jgi:hypothetical protein
VNVRRFKGIEIEPSAPPHSVEHEQATLGALLLDWESWDKVADLRPDDFFRADHRLIFGAFYALAAEGKPWDHLIVCSWLESAGQLFDAGGPSYIGKLGRDTTATAATIRSHAEILREKSALRKAQAFGVEIESAVANGASSVEVHERIRSTLERLQSSSPQARRIATPIWFQDAAPNLARRDAVDELLGVGSLSSIYGGSGSGKTFFALDLALAIARGGEWCGRPVLRGIVLYAAGEGHQSVLLRLAAYRLHHFTAQLRTLPFATIPESINLLDPAKHVDAVVALAKQAESDWELPTVLIVIDTLARSIAGGNENAPEVMGAAIQSADRLRELTGAHVLLVHHTGKNDSNGARGHSSLKAALDTEIEVTGLDGVRIAKVTKQRDFAIGTTFAFTLKPVVIGTNPETGKEVASCIVEHVEAPQQSARRVPSTRNQGALLAGLREFIREKPEVIITPADLQQIAKTQGIKHRARLAEAREGLLKHGWIIETVGGIRVAEDHL